MVFPSDSTCSTISVKLRSSHSRASVLLLLYFIVTMNVGLAFPDNPTTTKATKTTASLPFSEKFSQINIKELGSTFEDITIPGTEDFPNVKSHFGDIPKDESETKSRVMPSWTLKMPKLILSPEHFMINDRSKDFVKDQIEKASKDGLNTPTYREQGEEKETPVVKDNDKNGDLSLEEINGDSTKSSLPKKEETHRKRSTNKSSSRRRIPFPPKRPLRPSRYPLRRNKREFSWVFRNTQPTKFPTIFSQSNGFRLTRLNEEKSGMIKKNLFVSEKEEEEQSGKGKNDKLTPIVEYDGEELQRLIQEAPIIENPMTDNKNYRSKRSSIGGGSFPNIFNQANNMFIGPDIGRVSAYPEHHQLMGLFLGQPRKYLYTNNVGSDLVNHANVFHPSLNRFERANKKHKQTNFHRNNRNPRGNRPPPRYPPFDPFGNTAYIPLPGQSNPSYALPLQSAASPSFSGPREVFRRRPFQSPRTVLGQKSSLIRGSPFQQTRGNRGNRDRRPIRNVYIYPQTLKKEGDVRNNEVSTNDDSFSYVSSSEFESSNLYKKLRNYSKRGSYRLP